MRQIITLIYFLLILNFCHAQRLNKIYYGVSSDSLHSGHQIEFKDNGILELTTFSRHMSKQFRLPLSYKTYDNLITISKSSISKSDSLALVNNRFEQFLNTMILIIDGKALIDNSARLVYVQYNDFKSRYLYYSIDNKLYKQATGLPDAYGLINVKMKENKILKGKMESIKDDLKNYDLKIFRGLEAYEKFGYSSVFGVIEMKSKL